MSVVEQAFCRSAPWRAFAGHIVLPWALQAVEPAGTLLEIGGGSGDMAEHTLRRSPGLHLTLIDIDPAMVAAAQRRLAAAANARAVLGDVTDLPFDDASFDIVASYLMLHHVISWQDAIREVSRVLRPGGTFVGYDLHDTRLTRLVHRLDRSPHRLISVDELRTALLAAGLEVGSVAGRYGQLIRFVARKPRRL